MNKIEFIKNCMKPGIFVAAGKLICAVIYCNKKLMDSAVF
jgi:hypothetical protein